MSTAPSDLLGGWTLARLSEVAEVRSGITKGGTRRGAGSVTVPYLRVANVQDGHIDLSEVKQIEVLPEHVERYRLQPGDVLMTEGGDPDKLGRGAVWRGKIDPCIHQNHVFRVRTATDRLLPEYLSAFLGSVIAKKYFRRAAKQTTGIASINKTQLSGLPVSLPPLPEQRRIAAILDKADAIRRKRQQAIQLSEELLRSVFLDMFGDPVTNPKGWPWTKLGRHLAARPQIGTIKPASGEGSLPVVRVGDIGGPDVALHRASCVSLPEAEARKYLLGRGDVILARAIGSESHLGKASIFQGSERPVVFDSHVMRLRLAPGRLLPEFLWHWLKSEGGRSRFMSRAGQTAVQFNINAGQIANIDIALPPIELQGVFSKLACQTGEVRSRACGHAAHLTELYGSLVDGAFSAHLREVTSGSGGHTR